MIRGYYCLAPGLQLSQATLERFLTGIGLKGYGVPEQPQDLAPPPLSPSDEVELEKSKESAKEQLLKQKSDKDICDGMRYGHPDYVDEADRRQLSREMCE